MEENKFDELLAGVLGTLTDEQKEQAKACESVDQLMKLLGELGVELPDELMDEVGGGFNLDSLFHRPMIVPTFKYQESSSEEAVHMDVKGKPAPGAIHMDVKGASSFNVVHTDVSAASKSNPTRYV